MARGGGGRAREEEEELKGARRGYREASSEGNREEEARWANVIGDIHKRRGEYVEALRWLRIDYEVTVKHLPQRHLIESCQSLGEAYLRLGRFSEALTYQVRHHHSRITPTCIRSSGLFGSRLRVKLDYLRFGFSI
jgi:tetratricopeptide (TPR) repeat protein